MDDRRLQSLVAELDSLVPRDGALIRIGEFLNETDDPALVGNRAGYLRLGIELLKLADAPPIPGRPERIRANLSYLVDATPTVGEWATFERRENVRTWADERRRHYTLKERLQALGGLAAGLTIAAAIVVGLVMVLTSVIEFVAHLFRK